MDNSVRIQPRGISRHKSLSESFVKILISVDVFKSLYDEVVIFKSSKRKNGSKEVLSELKKGTPVTVFVFSSVQFALVNIA